MGMHRAADGLWHNGEENEMAESFPEVKIGWPVAHLSSTGNTEKKKEVKIKSHSFLLWYEDFSNENTGPE